ncbi:rhomboid family intramembrane serine protease [Variovorax terrae]|uniref:Rhomboid family intramembrane serine protease n=1 Tax=Variovorax terrae TaxID=2923278 RepID=A0A9X1W0H4_9BURK|nr:rhomboid family intramembrane serine protease [Variovorax terrae]MCJ0763823.1 rhomboid family intramembrane serine protease [Variovorax terrae]
MSGQESLGYRVVLDGQEVGPYDRRTIIGMRIRKTLNNGHVLIDAQGGSTTVGDLIGRPPPRPSTGFAASRDLLTSGQFPTFDVRFSGALGFVGAGEARVQPDVLRLAGRRRRWGLWSREARVKLPLDCLQDVAVEGATLSFGLSPQAPFDAPVRASRLSCVLDSAEAARELQSLLPTRTSPQAEQQRQLAQRLAAYPHRAWGTGVLLVLNLLGFALLLAQGGDPLGVSGQLLVASGSGFGPLVRDGELWRLLTALFLHGSLLSLLVSLWALWDLGRLAERLMGLPKFLIVYAASGLLGGLAGLWWDPWGNGAGASGAIFGLLGGLLMYLSLPGNGVSLSVMRKHLVPVAALVGYALWAGLASPGIGPAVQGAGLVMGALCALVLSQPPREWPELWTLMARVLLTVLTVAAGLLLWSQTPNRGPAYRADQAFAAELSQLMGEQQRRAAQLRQLPEPGQAGDVRDKPTRELLMVELRDHQRFWQDSVARLGKLYLPKDARMSRLQAALKRHASEQQELSAQWLDWVTGPESPEARRQLAEARSQAWRAEQSLQQEWRALAALPR